MEISSITRVIEITYSPGFEDHHGKRITYSSGIKNTQRNLYGQTIKEYL
jgi:hypothetical protein